MSLTKCLTPLVLLPWSFPHFTQNPAAREMWQLCDRVSTRNSVSTAKERTGDQVQAAQIRALPLPLALCGEEHTGGFLALSSLALYFQHQKGELL